MKNNYVIEGNITKIYFRKKDGYFEIDTEDLENVSKYTWYLASNGYACTKENGKHLYCHQVVMGKAPNGLVTDHKNRNKLDNKKENLWFCTYRDNLLNRSDSYSHRKTYYKNGYGNMGIRYREGKRKNTYKVEVHRQDNKTIYIGSYRTLEKAISVRDIAFLLVEKGELTPFHINLLRNSQ